MKRRTIRQGIYLAALIATTAVIIDRVGSTNGVEAQDVRTPILNPIQIAPITLAPAPVTSLESAVRQTAAIAEGVVADIRYDYSDEEGPWTTVLLTNVRSIAGDAPQTLEIRQFGGPLPKGALMVAAELPVFVPGKEYIVFLRNTEWNMSPVVGDLALRVEKTDIGEVVVNADGQPVTKVDANGFDFGPILYEPFDRDGSAPKVIDSALRSLTTEPLDRAQVTESLRSTLAAQGLQVTGSFSEKPTAAFNWRAQDAVRSPLDQAPVDSGIREPEPDDPSGLKF